MFDAEKLLGTIMREATGFGKKSKKKGSGNTLVNSLKSGTGLMTAIGLGIGAYEILRSKSQSQPADPAHMPSALPAPPPVSGGSPFQQGPPPVPPPLQATARQTPATAATVPTPTAATAQELAQRMIRVMIAAAHADGAMDEEEEQAVLARLKAENLSQEERMFLLNELHNPQPLAELTAGIDDPSTAKAIYMLAVSAVAIDTEAERRWFDELATRLGLSRGVQSFIEEQS
jgi:uncharacterized membrane protein YebE (DUF533 family)